MCVVSMITDHYQDKWPLPKFPAPGDVYPYESDKKVTPFTPGVWPFPLKTVIITKEQWEEYQALKRKAMEYDKNTNQPDCVKPESEKWESDWQKILKNQGILK